MKSKTIITLVFFLIYITSKGQSLNLNDLFKLSDFNSEFNTLQFLKTKNEKWFNHSKENGVIYYAKPEEILEVHTESPRHIVYTLTSKIIFDNISHGTKNLNLTLLSSTTKKNSDGYSTSSLYENDQYAIELRSVDLSKNKVGYIILVGIKASKVNSESNRNEELKESKEFISNAENEDIIVPDPRQNDKNKTQKIFLKDENEEQQSSIKPIEREEEIYTLAEQMPYFPDGEEAFKKYLAKNLKYPPLEKERGISGAVYVSFVIDTDGSVKNAKVERSVPNGEGLSKEALRVIESMPKWNAGKQNGRSVKVLMKYPIKFALR